MIRAALLMLMLASAARAEPAPPEPSSAVTAMQVGVLCQPRALRTEAAPDTELGYISIADGTPSIAFEGQQVPAALGLSFGVMVVPSRSIAEVRLQTYRPDRAQPENFASSFIAGEARLHFFSFEFPQEQVPGLWRMEAWEGDSLLYRVEFQVLPEAALPDMVAHCRAMS